MLSVPHPNFFDGKGKVRRHNRKDFEEIPLTHGFTQNCRGLGIMDMAYAIRVERPHRASGELCLHVLEIMHGLLLASREGRHYEIQSVCERPEALPLDLPEHRLDREDTCKIKQGGAI